MSNREHLVQMSVIDVNGHKRTVYVKPRITQRNTRTRNLPNPGGRSVSTGPSVASARRLAHDSRSYLASKGSTSDDVLRILASDSSAHVRRHVSSNANASAQTLGRIVKSSTSLVARVSDALSQTDDHTHDTLLNVALHPNTDETTLRKLSVMTSGKSADAAKIAYRRVTGERYIPHPNKPWHALPFDLRFATSHPDYAFV